MLNKICNTYNICLDFKVNQQKQSSGTDTLLFTICQQMARINTSLCSGCADIVFKKWWLWRPKLYTHEQFELNMKTIHISHTEYFELLKLNSSIHKTYTNRTLIHDAYCTYSTTMSHAVWNTHTQTDGSAVGIRHFLPHLQE